METGNTNGFPLLGARTHEREESGVAVPQIQKKGVELVGFVRREMLAEKLLKGIR